MIGRKEAERVFCKFGFSKGSYDDKQIERAGRGTCQRLDGFLPGRGGGERENIRRFPLRFQGCCP